MEANGNDMVALMAAVLYAGNYGYQQRPELRERQEQIRKGSIEDVVRVAERLYMTVLSRNSIQRIKEEMQGKKEDNR